jgi:cytochrome c-type biogenesis protein CcmH
MIARLALVAVVALSFGQTLSGGDLESEARAIDAMLIAPCCFSQQVSVHQSAAAHEVRRDVRARLAAGQTRQQVLDAYVAQYGTRILAEPPAAGFNLALYVMPFLMLIASLGVVAVILRRLAKPRPVPKSGLQGASAAIPRSANDETRLDDALRDLD